MKEKIKELLTRIASLVWKKPIPAKVNSSTKYLANLKESYYPYTKQIYKGKSEYCLNLVMLATLDYLCEVCLDNPTAIWPARYAFLVNLRSDVSAFMKPKEDSERDDYGWMPKAPGVFVQKFGSLEVVCTYSETKRLEASGEEIEVFILDKWPAYLHYLEEKYSKAISLLYYIVCISIGCICGFLAVKIHLHI